MSASLIFILAVGVPLGIIVWVIAIGLCLIVIDGFVDLIRKWRGRE